MLQETKITQTLTGPRTFELREGTSGRGATVYSVVSYTGDGYNKSYHEELFDSFAECISWYNSCN